jgi:hypothetical protein
MILFFIFLFFSATSALLGAQFTVTSTSNNPADSGSLHYAINQANHTAGSHTIVMNLPSNSTITLNNFGLPPMGSNITSLSSTSIFFDSRLPWRVWFSLY